MAVSATTRDGGFILVLVAGLMVLICVLAAFAIDLSRVYVAKTKMRNAGDASSLAAVGAIFPSSASPTPNWSAASTAAAKVLQGVSIDGEDVSQVNLVFGWWNVLTNDWEPGYPAAPGAIPVTVQQGICSASKAPCTSDSGCAAGTEFCFIKQAPAVGATVRKETGVNGGAIVASFAKVFGWQQFDSLQAQSVAIADYPRAVSAGTVFPFAVSQKVRDDLFAGNPSSVGVITLTDAYGGGPAGQWTRLAISGTGSANLLADYISYLKDPASGTPSPAVRVAGYDNPAYLSYNDTIHLENGTMTALENPILDLIAAGKPRVVMPVVATDPAPGTDLIVRGFVTVELTEVSSPPLVLKGRLILPTKLVR
ncbi:Tad domain-containing protein [Geomonas sp. Red32]|uniref:Tad domain-containing protein n=1 Tax=Geomonas sp. Red32 TaxID=2912856 RepID=UPI00202CD1A6|nr:Tad domain-containing protein [Geomonas sp. Red32]MCM0082876.1 Tad domain-containing protein [Geomonas sp. Red32]